MKFDDEKFIELNYFKLLIIFLVKTFLNFGLSDFVKSIIFIIHINLFKILEIKNHQFGLLYFY